MRRILVVDNESGMRALLSKIFTRAGYDVRTAGNGPQAMSLLGGEPFDAMLSSVSVLSTPTLDGHDLVRWVVRNHPAVRCVLTTALDIDCEECPFASGCTVLAKPFSPNEAVAIMERVLSDPPN